MNLVKKQPSDIQEQYNDLNSVNDVSVALTEIFPLENYSEKLQIRDNMTDREIIMLLFKNSFWIIWSQFFFGIFNNITLQILGNLNLEKHFEGTMPLIYIGDVHCLYSGIGYGIIFSSFYFSLKFANKNKNEELGNFTLYSIILIFFYTLILFLIILFFSDYFMGFLDLHKANMIKKYLLIGHFYILVHLINSSFTLFLFVKNLNVYSAIFDTITCLVYFLIMKFYFEVKFSKEKIKENFSTNSLGEINNEIDIVKAEEEIYITIAWILNIVFLFQFSLYIFFFLIKRPFRGTKILSFRKYSKGLWVFLTCSLDFILISFFNLNLSSDLNLLFVNEKKSNYLQISGFKISQGIIEIIQNISTGYFFAMVKISKRLKSKKLNGFLSRLIKLYFYFTIPIIIFLSLLVFIFADFIPLLFTNDENVKIAMVEYLRVMVFIVLPFHFEISMRGILISYKKTRFLTYVYFLITIFYNLPVGLILSKIYTNNISVYISAYSTEVFFGLIFFYYVTKLKSYEVIDEEQYSIISI